MGQQKPIRLGSMRLWVRSLASLSELRIWRCHELWCTWQTRLGSGIAMAVAVAMAGSCSSDWTPSLGASICYGCNPEKTKQTKNLNFSLVLVQTELDYCASPCFEQQMSSQVSRSVGWSKEAGIGVHDALRSGLSPWGFHRPKASFCYTLK